MISARCKKCGTDFWVARPNEYDLCPRCRREQSVIQAAAEWADMYDRWHALTGRDSYAVVSGLCDLLEKKEQQLRGAYTALAALDGEPK